MGQQNRARRAAKAKAKQRNRSERADSRTRFDGHRAGGPTAGPGVNPADAVRIAISEAVKAPAGSAERECFIPALLTLPVNIVDREIEDLTEHLVANAWSSGWQPNEVARQSRLRGATAATTRLVLIAVAVDHASRAASTLDHRWAAQIAALMLPEVKRHGWFRAWMQDEAVERDAALAVAIDVIAILFALPVIEQLLPPPGSTQTGAPAATQISSEMDPLLEKIRNLLAKAESTTFEAEATALTAKAQELMTRHAVDAAALHTDDRSDDEHPVTIRIPIDPPYVDAKALLLQTVAEAGRCRSLRHTSIDMSSVVGFADDVATVEMLFTSLLVQAQRALNDAARSAPAGTRVRSQSYRSTFLLAYTDRIGDRLEEINQHVFAQATAEHGSSFLPALRSRADQVDDHIRVQFGDLTSSRVRGGYDRAGWSGGRMAADRATINLADLEADAPPDDQAPVAELSV